MRIRQFISDLTDLDPQHYFLSAFKKNKLPYSFFFRHRGWGGQAKRRTKNCQKEAGWLIRRHGGLEVRVPTVPVYHCFKRKVLVRGNYLAAATQPSLRVTWGKCWIWSWDIWVNSLVLMTTWPPYPLTSYRHFILWSRLSESPAETEEKKTITKKLL